jgi:spore maturation protein CgeB
LETATLDRFRHSAKVALWLFDNLVRLPASIDHVRHVDALFCFDQNDVDWYRARGESAFFLPQACDPRLYYPIPDIKKDIDILFIGSLYYSPRRKALLTAVAEHFADRKVEVYGWYQPWFKGLVAWMRRPYKQVFKNVNVSSEQANRLYNRARIVLNVHQEYQKDGANPRVFEICGAGAYQLCDWNPYVASLFPDGSVGFYRDAEALVSMIGEALETNTDKAASCAHRIVMSEHTFKKRMEQVLNTLSLD